ncbi:hypothetical protein DEJ15_10345 [Curtobacterium sp. MCJR17_043]|nr:hypothetical protein [Curtobacterium sp. MCJR17_043]WIB34933.1 hypothetical protein DEJ15_10345 [Curtobacterium sp. MCJR17_043]
MDDPARREGERGFHDPGVPVEHAPVEPVPDLRCAVDERHVPEPRHPGATGGEVDVDVLVGAAPTGTAPEVDDVVPLPLQGRDDPAPRRTRSRR